MVKDLSDMRYEIVAATLHNDLLDIHPFSDRNGSTSILFLELIMAKSGYVPSMKREKDYYKHLRKILDDNLLAISVVKHQHRKIGSKFGYFQGETIPESQKPIYEKCVDLLRNRHMEYEKERKAAKKQAKKDKKKKSE